MRVIMTGATGYVGGAALRVLEDRGHEALAIVRSDHDAEALEERGHSALNIALTDLDGLSYAASRADGAIHCAASDNPAFWPVSEAAALALMRGLPDGAGFTAHSGTVLLGDTGTDPVAPQMLSPPPPLAARADLDRAVLKAGENKLRTTLVYAPLVFGRGTGAAVPSLMVAAALKSGYALVPGDGSALWSSVHVDDLGALLVDAMMTARSGASIAIAAGPVVRMSDLTGLIGRVLDFQVRSASEEEAEELFGFFATTLSLNYVFSDTPARALGWSPAASQRSALKSALVEIALEMARQ